MRIATLIIALMMMVIVGVQSCAVYLGGGLTQQQGLSQSGAVGLVVALLFLVGGAFVLAFPLVSLASFALAALMTLVGWNSGFSDMKIWFFVCLILAVMSFFGFREKRRRTWTQQR